MKGNFALVFFIIVLVVVSLLLPLASEYPDGLEKVAEHLDFAGEGETLYEGSPFPDYDTLGKENYFSTFLANLLGMIITVLVALGLGYLLKNARKQN
ncbi:MAG: PDGLE domain-containing protein [Nanobdellota archaeon]